MGRENILKYQLEHNDHETDLKLSISEEERKLAEEQQFLKQQPPPKKIKFHSNFPFTLSKDSTLQDFLHNNQYYVENLKHNHSTQIFDLNAKGQSPHTLWIGCSDSRAGDQCLATLPGEVFVHRNIANIINSNDNSSQGAIQFAIDVLKVKKIIVCGHTDCGGVWASLSSKKIGGVLDSWLNPIRQIRADNLKLLAEFNSNPKLKARKLSELNIINSVKNLKRHPSVSQALKDKDIEVWGLIYDVSTGFLSEVEVPQDEHEDLFHIHDEGGHEDELGDHNGH
ncbi:putative carbonic anhydrase [Scheffersomyces coipomensis]|uniref:putative carbonic anhydrase n=1 Tax=Scheffersomyces coipomensis TaxID=1788519 RepID=UPI00315DE09C